jgi:hypothetical protein
MFYHFTIIANLGNMFDGLTLAIAALEMVKEPGGVSEKKGWKL